MFITGILSSSQILQFAQDLHLDGLIVLETGCLGKCGNGPNVAVSPPDVVLNHMATPARLAEAMRAVCDADVSPAVLRSTELRLAGNAQARQGDLQVIRSFLVLLKVLNCLSGVFKGNATSTSFRCSREQPVVRTRRKSTDTT